jgi:hypothetical protein
MLHWDIGRRLLRAEGCRKESQEDEGAHQAANL